MEIGLIIAVVVVITIMIIFVVDVKQDLSSRHNYYP